MIAVEGFFGNKHLFLFAFSFLILFVSEFNFQCCLKVIT